MIVLLLFRLVSLLHRRQKPRFLGVSVRPSCPLLSRALGEEKAWRRLCWWCLLVSGARLFRSLGEKDKRVQYSRWGGTTADLSQFNCDYMYIWSRFLHGVEQPG